MKLTLSILESRLQKLVEGTAILLLPRSLKKESFLVKLTETMHAGVSVGQDAALIAPNLYTIELNPADMPTTKDTVLLLENLSLYLAEAGEEVGYQFPGKPVARFEANPNIQLGEIEVRALNSLETLTPTRGLEIEPSASENIIPNNAFLIIDGTDVIKLSASVINIGRRADNHLVLSDPSVSRIHAQLRSQGGTYIVFDLDSASGTKVNGKEIHKQELHSGDVITIGNIPLVYGENELFETLF